VNFFGSGSDEARREAAFWSGQVPLATDPRLLQLAVDFPVRSSASSPPIDSPDFPFGRLTFKGMEQMESVGAFLASRCLRTGHDPTLSAAPSMRVLSTNYARYSLVASPWRPRAL
jgi:hypothetical protein